MNNTDTPTEKAPTLGGFFVNEIEKNIVIDMTDDGSYLGDLLIGNFRMVIVRNTQQELYYAFLQQLHHRLWDIVLEVEMNK